GQKVNPKVFRLGITADWSSRWFAKDALYRKHIVEDNKIRKALLEKLKPAGIAKVEIERSINAMTITIHVARPGVVIGRGGAGLEELKQYVISILVKGQVKKEPLSKIDLRVEPVKDPALEAYLMATNIADQLVKRMYYKRILRQSLERIMQSGAKGAKILLSGRISGAEIARREKVTAGKLPLSTLRERIDFSSVAALTKSGYVGVKVWINKPEGK
ncbi:30S ribosomal protein S3, partial [Candidatus Microgenomates bacterium]|nr:30S ribosomal protein S3 [Candidatus Microgenomates bacterium]